jgi:signal recognition particle receptor subunit beta
MSAFIFVFDSSDHERIDDAHEELHQLTKNENFGEKPILIFANKQDLPNAMNSDQIRDKLELEKLKKTIKWHIQTAIATKSQGLQQGFEWLINAVQEKDHLTKPIVETFNDTIDMKNNFFSKFNLDQIKAMVNKFFSIPF